MLLLFRAQPEEKLLCAPRSCCQDKILHFHPPKAELCLYTLSYRLVFEPSWGYFLDLLKRSFSPRQPGTVPLQLPTCCSTPLFLPGDPGTQLWFLHPFLKPKGFLTLSCTICSLDFETGAKKTPLWQRCSREKPPSVYQWFQKEISNSFRMFLPRLRKDPFGWQGPATSTVQHCRHVAVFWHSLYRVQSCRDDSLVLAGTSV